MKLITGSRSSATRTTRKRTTTWLSSRLGECEPVISGSSVQYFQIWAIVNYTMFSSTPSYFLDKSNSINTLVLHVVLFLSVNVTSFSDDFNYAWTFTASNDALRRSGDSLKACASVTIESSNRERRRIVRASKDSSTRPSSEMTGSPARPRHHDNIANPAESTKTPLNFQT